MPSQARQKLRVRLADIDDILAAHAAAAGPGRGWKHKVAALNKGALVLLTAHLEAFLEELYAEALAAIVAARIPSSAAPDRLKLTALRGTANDIRSSSDRAKRDDHTLRLLKRAERLGHPRKRLSAGDVDTASVLRDFANPRPESIDWLFSNLGIVGILGRVRWQGKSSAAVRADLERMVEKRNKIAHGELGANVYKEDVRYHRQLVERLADRLDQIVGAHVASLTQKAAW